jgi:NitT/TauT family transport system substrate-binding protein
MVFRLTAILLFLVLGACQRGRPEGDAVTIRIATTRGTLLYFPVHLAQSLGYYREEGIDVVIDELGSAPKSMQALVGGSVDIAAGGFISLLLLRAEHRSLQAFLLLVRDPGYVALV